MGYWILAILVLLIVIALTVWVDKTPKWVTFILQLMCGIYLAVGQFISGTEARNYESKSVKFGLLLLYEQRTALTIAAAILVIVSSQIDQFPHRRRGRKFRRDLLEAMLFELFENDKIEIRITIFHDVWWIKEQWLNIYRFLLYKSPIGLSQRKDFQRSHYIVIDERIGEEHNNSKRCFPWSNKKLSDCQGVAARARFKKMTECVDDAPDIKDINISEIATLIRSDNRRKQAQQQQRLSLYMQRTYMSDIYLISKLNWRATQILAQPIFNSNGDVIGVLVIDSCRSLANKIPFDNPVLQSNVDRYVKLIGKTY